MTISRGDRYYCSARREKGTCAADRGIGAPELEERVLGGLKDLLLGNEALVEEFAAEFKRELARFSKERHGDHRCLSRDLEQVERSIKRRLDFIAGGDGDPGSVRDKLQELDQRWREIVVELAAGNSTIEIHPNLPDLYRRKVGELRQLLEDDTTRPQAFEIIRSLVNRIEISPGQRRGCCEVVVVGALAQVSRVCA
jgi:hypothetical protein